MAGEIPKNLMCALQTLHETSPIDVERSQDFKIRTDVVETTLNAVSEYEAALKTAFLLGKFMKIPRVFVESMDSKKEWEYQVFNSVFREYEFPRVVLLRQCINGDIEETSSSSNDVNISRITSVSPPTMLPASHFRSLTSDSFSSICKRLTFTVFNIF